MCTAHPRRSVLRLLAADDRACTCIPATQTIGELPSYSAFSVISVITKTKNKKKKKKGSKKKKIPRDPGQVMLCGAMNTFTNRFQHAAKSFRSKPSVMPGVCSETTSKMLQKIIQFKAFLSTSTSLLLSQNTPPVLSHRHSKEINVEVAYRKVKYVAIHIKQA